MIVAVIAGLVIAASVHGTAAQACANGAAQEINGNWYCQAVNAITYSNFDAPGTYNKVTTMENGVCGSTPQDYSGAIAPMDEEVSWHFRGPLQLKHFASYSPGSAASKRSVRPSPKQRRHGHQHFHAKDKELVEIQDNHTVEEKRGVGDMVTATIDGQVVSWTNEYAGPGSMPTSAAEAGPADNRVAPTAPQVAPPPPAPAASPSAQPSDDSGSGSWDRQAYYDASSQIADGLVFLNHNGGQGSGVFDYTWGNSLSYASPDGTTGSASPQTLADTLLGDDVEIVIMTDAQCSNGDCGTVRPGTVAYHGFEGANKLFLIEFSMPLTGKTGFNADMPAIWALNAQIPNTLQYGEATCSCWDSGCGEFDIFEILDSGNMRAKSTWHGNVPGGDSNYFDRPTGSTMKAAVLFDGNSSTASIVVLPDDTVFSPTLSADQVSAFLSQVTGVQAASFALGS